MTITKKFRSVTWAAAVASAALSCYLISYRVSEERASLEQVEDRIEEARGDIVALTTEFETRSRMSQLERWSRRDLALGAPAAAQFVEGEVELASLFGHEMPAEADVRSAAAHDTLREDRRVDEDIFETPDLDAPPPDRVQTVSYTVPEQGEVRPRLALMDASVQREIAAEAAAENAGETGPD